MAGRPELERDSRRIIRRLESEGWQLVKMGGSHHKFKHPSRKHHIVVVHPAKDLPTGTARAIAKAAGWI
jgi:predicted RNA binding protein YcfA (HicA-like mRNA interferase family)